MAKAIDWEFWAHMPALQVWQACALSVGIEPDNLKPIAHGWMDGVGGDPIFEEKSFPSRDAKEGYSKRLRLLTAYLTDSDHFRIHTLDIYSKARCQIYMADFARWAVFQMKWESLPPEIVVLAESLPNMRPTKIEGSPNIDEADKLPTTPAITASVPITSSQDWHQAARDIADDLDRSDANGHCHDSIKNISERVSVEMRKRKIYGPRGPISDTTILREALQGGRWKRKR